MKTGSPMSIAAALVAVFLWAVPAHGQPVCGPYDGLSRTLVARYGEAVRGAGISDDGQRRIEIWRAANGASWSVVIVRVDGVACLVASGLDWEVVPLGPPPGPLGARPTPGAGA